MKENQLPLEFHISSHGYRFPLGIDSINPFKRLSPNNLLLNCIKCLCIQFGENTEKEKLIKFMFHICNGAFIEIDKDDNKDEIAEKMKSKSFIGIFMNIMNEFGYNNIMVVGYRGFYTSMWNGSGIRIGNRLIDPTIDIDCKQTEYVIHTDGKVDIPRNYNLELFPCKYA